VKEKKPVLVFLMETMMRSTKLQSIRRHLGFDSLLTVDPVGVNANNKVEAEKFYPSLCKLNSQSS
jgi:hypothetical protein